MAAGGTQIELCGRLVATWAGRPLEGALRGRQGRLLFAYLVLHRHRPVRRDELVAAVWPGDDAPPNADALLPPLLSRLRRDAGPDALIGRAELTLVLPGDAEVDVEQALRDLEAARAAAAARDWLAAGTAADRAVACVERGLLPGLEAPWIEERRVALEDLRVEALELAALAGLGLGGDALPGAHTAARAAVAAAPFRESARVLLLRVLRARGNDAEALRAFDEARVLLRDELGTAPGPALLALHAELLAGEPVAPAAAPAASKGLPDRLAAAAATPLVGRAAALERLHEAQARAAAGETGLVFLLGEGGIGKTRLVAELARTPGFAVLYGRCDEEELFPFGPWIEMLGGHLAGIPDAELPALLGEEADELARLIPDLGARVPGVEPPPLAAPEVERRRLFDAIVSLVRRLARRGPLLMVIDDLHWADRSSLQLGRHLVRSAPLGPVLLIGTYRDTDLHDGHPLVEQLALLERDLEAELPRLRLEGLAEDETHALVASWHGDGELSARDVRTMHRETNGNPFFVKQLVRHHEEAGGHAVPAGVRDVIAHRVGRLPEQAGKVLRAGALIGRDFDFDLLGDVTGGDEDALLDVLDAAVRAGLLTEVPSTPGRYSFIHALVRTTLENEVSATRRAVLHGRIAGALCERWAARLDAVLVDVARHYLLAGPGHADAAVAFAARAAEQAQARLAYDEAAAFLADAVAAQERAGRADPAAVARLRARHAMAVWHAGRWVESRGLFARAADAAREAGDVERFAEAALGHAGGAHERYGTEDPEALVLLEEALGRLPAEDSPLRARLLARLAQVLYYDPDPDDRAPRLADEALAMARRTGHDGAVVAALGAVQFAQWRPGRTAARLALSEEQVELTERMGVPAATAEAHTWRVAVLLEACRRHEAEASIARHAELARGLGLPHLVVHAAAFRAMLALLDGDWAAAEQAAFATLAEGERSQAFDVLQFFGVEMIALRNEQDRLGELVPAFEQLVRDVDALPGWRVAYAWALVQAGRPADARAELAGLRADGFAALPFDTNFDAALTIVAHVAGELGDAELAAEVEPLLRPYENAWLVMGPGPATLGPIAYAVGLCALLRGDLDRALADFELGLTRAREMRARPYVARCLAGMAAALRRRDASGDAAAADAHEGEARRLASALGMVRLQRELDLTLAA